jgi:hypothetical protein
MSITPLLRRQTTTKSFSSIMEEAFRTRSERYSNGLIYGRSDDFDETSYQTSDIDQFFDFAHYEQETTPRDPLTEADSAVGHQLIESH